ncbi:MAG: thermonuclease family protein [Candidatus Omnitrophica bacterium]|nr:thermonuclease family protein [Candidatus Omnitrophota bacterium]
MRGFFLKYFGFLVIAILAGFGILLSSVVKAPQSADFENARVVHVYDGDTVKLDNGEHVRLLGIDAPEMHENPKLMRDSARSGMDTKTILTMGREAYRYVKPLVDQKQVRLEFDVVRRDKYGRLLAYLYLTDGTFVNAEIIKNGYAYPMTIPPNVRHADEFKEYFKEARAANLGLWGKGNPADGPSGGKKDGR